jgi:hypothetical protein
MRRVYAYIHPELNILCCALIQEAVPENVNPLVLDVEAIDDVILDNGVIRVKSNEEKLYEAKQNKLSQLKSYTANLLSSTDYIITKIAEAQLSNDTDLLNTLKQKYSSQIQQRAEIRAWSEATKQAINNASTIEELNNIFIQFGGGK